METTIYKKDNSGKLRYLKISTNVSELIQESGVIGTSSPLIHKSISKGKNIGKTNETSPIEQAKLEANSKITEKLRNGYFLSIEEAEKEGGSNFLSPMLAKDYNKNRVSYPCFGQPKLDGMRSFFNYTNEKFSSRTGKTVETVNHILFPTGIENVLDGELYAHGLNFQENMKILKKYRKGETEKVTFHVYDVVMDAPYRERRDFLLEYCSDLDNIEIVETVVLLNEQQLKNYHALNLQRGYEGTILRVGENSYELNHRSDSLLKYKDFLDETYTIIDVIPSDKRPEHGVIVCKGIDKDDVDFTFKTGMKFSHADREEILKNKSKYIGQKAEVRFFEFSDSGIPRFPVCVGFRLDK